MIKLVRDYHEGYTLGTMFRDGVEIAKTLELPWKDNLRNISCIPQGEYRVTKEPPIEKDDKLGRKYRPYWHFRIHNVPNRSGILIHRITFVKDLRGCIGVASRFWDLNKDGIPDAVESGKKLQWLVDNLPDEFQLNITAL